jgi:hypothetical protein
MITKEKALELVDKYVSSTPCRPGNTWVVLKDATEEFEGGWFFYYNTSQYAKSRESGLFVVGLCPIIVDKETGDLYYTGPLNPNHYIELFKEDRSQLDKLT